MFLRAIAVFLAASASALASLPAVALNGQMCLRNYLLPLYKPTVDCPLSGRPPGLAYSHYGFQDTETPANPAHLFTILLLGKPELGEETLALEQTFAKQLQSELKALTGRKLRVINGTFAEFTAVDTLAVMNRAIELYKPDLVLYRLGTADNVIATSALARVVPRSNLRPPEFTIPFQTTLVRIAGATSHRTARSFLFSAGLLPVVWPWLAGDELAAQKTMDPVLAVLADMKTVTENHGGKFAVIWNGEKLAVKAGWFKGPLRYLFWVQQIVSPLKRKIVLSPPQISLMFAEKNISLVTNSRVRGFSNVRKESGEAPEAPELRVKQEVLLLTPSLVGLAM